MESNQTQNNNFTKKSYDELFHSSQNQFLSTVFENKLVEQKKKKKFDGRAQQSVQTEINDNRIESKFKILTQYSLTYDPLNEHFFHVKGRMPEYRKIKLKETIEEEQSINTKSSKAQKNFVQIYQPRKIEYENEYKLYQQELRKKQALPGPGAYNISKPLAPPILETIQKNENIVLVKLNNSIEGTSNFKSGQQKLNAIYDKQKMRNPGPGQYELHSRRQRAKSKLEEYAKGYESNYKFIFEVFNSQYQHNVSMPNYSINDASNGTQYNGKPEKIQQLNLRIKKQNIMKQERSRKILLERAKLPSFSSQLQRKRSLTTLQNRQNEYKRDHVFQFKTVAEDQPNREKQKMQIRSQVDQKIIGKYSSQMELGSWNQKQTVIKQKLKQLMQLDKNNIQNKKHIYSRKEHLYQGIGYFDGSQKQKLNTKYNVKLQKRNQTLKKMMQPLPNRSSRFQSLQVEKSSIPSINHKLKQKGQQRYNLNMMDLLVNKKAMEKSFRSNNNNRLPPNSRISFMNQLGLEKSYLSKTIQYD